MKISKDKTDKLFSDNLENYTKAPREQAWIKLEAKLQQKQKKTGPIWQRLGFAASIIMLVFAGILAYFYQPSNTKNVHQVADNHIIKRILPLNVKRVDTDVATLGTPISLEKRIEIKTNSKSRNTPILQTAAEKSTFKSDNVNQQTPNLEINQQVGIINENVAQVLESQTAEKEKSPSEEITVVVTLANFEEQNKALPFENRDTEKKAKFVSRLFKQLINAKNGDKVEWNEIGIKPAKILARAEGRLKSTSDEFNSSYQSTKSKTIL